MPNGRHKAYVEQAFVPEPTVESGQRGCSGAFGGFWQVRNESIRRGTDRYRQFCCALYSIGGTAFSATSNRKLTRHCPSHDTVIQVFLHTRRRRAPHLTALKIMLSSGELVKERDAMRRHGRRASTPPKFDVPAALAWRNTFSGSGQRPGLCPYHMPNTPS